MGCKYGTLSEQEFERERERERVCASSQRGGDTALNISTGTLAICLETGTPLCVICWEGLERRSERLAWVSMRDSCVCRPEVRSGLKVPFVSGSLYIRLGKFRLCLRLTSITVMIVTTERIITTAPTTAPAIIATDESLPSKLVGSGEKN